MEQMPRVSYWQHEGQMKREEWRALGRRS